MSSKTKTTVNNLYNIQNLTILAGQTISDSVNLFATTASNLIIPVGMDGTLITFQGSIDGTIFHPIFEASGVQIEVTHDATSRLVALDPRLFYGIAFLRVVSSSAQVSDRALQIIPFLVS